MITFNGNKKVIRGKTNLIKKTIKKIILDHSYTLKQVDYIFVNDDEILRINNEALQHDYYTDIISFDYTEDKKIEGEIYISLERVADNAQKYKEEFHVELIRVILHGILHYVGYKDKTKAEAAQMRQKENQYIKEYNKWFHVEQN